MELSTKTDVLVPVRNIARMLALFFFVMVALPYFYNLGSAEIGCPAYELRTGESCYRILK